MFYKAIRFIVVIIFNIIYSIKIEGKQNLKKLSGGAIICSNHTSNMDPFFFSIAIPYKIRYMAKAEMFKTKFTNYLFGNLIGAFPVKRGENDLKALKIAINLVKNGEFLGIFPEGTRVKDSQEIDIKAGIGFIVSKTKAPVIPISIRGSTRIFSKIKIIIGEPIDFSSRLQDKASSNDYKEISETIMAEIKRLNKKSDNILIK